MPEEPEDTVDELEHRSETLAKDIEETKDDWERKQESSAVPGAVSEKDSEGAPNASTDNPDEADPDAGEADPPDDG